MSSQLTPESNLNLPARFEARVRKGVARRGAFPYLVTTTVSLALASAILARLTAGGDFNSWGDALWWAITTLTTVGYGDVVPSSAWGRCIGAFVMVLGVTFISFLTATVTSLFVSSEEADREAYRRDREAEMRETLQRIEDRLTAIEMRVRQDGGSPM
jgi:voltage-gated potassium channel